MYLLAIVSDIMISRNAIYILPTAVIPTLMILTLTSGLSGASGAYIYPSALGTALPLRLMFVIYPWRFIILISISTERMLVMVYLSRCIAIGLE